MTATAAPAPVRPKLKRGARIALRELRKHKWVTTHDLLNSGAGARFGARLRELRIAGCDIHQERMKGPDAPSGAQYTLVKDIDYDIERGDWVTTDHAAPPLAAPSAPHGPVASLGAAASPGAEERPDATACPSPSDHGQAVQSASGRSPLPAEALSLFDLPAAPRPHYTGEAA